MLKLYIYGYLNRVQSSRGWSARPDPDFWCAFEDGQVVVIGDEPANTINDRRRRRLLYRGAKENYSPCRSRVQFVCSLCTSR
jgi:hypothetical protein